MSINKTRRTPIQEFRRFLLPIMPNVTTGFGLPKTGYPKKTAAGDDGDLLIGLPKYGPRFTAFDDGTVYDNVTGLMWVANPNLCPAPIAVDGESVPMPWEDAIDACEGLSYAEHNDWRLPNINELHSIMFIMLTGQQIDYNFFTLYNTYYWSSTTYAVYTLAAWITEFVTGLTYAADKEETSLLLLPVRGGKINA